MVYKPLEFEIPKISFLVFGYQLILKVLLFKGNQRFLMVDFSNVKVVRIYYRKMSGMGEGSRVLRPLCLARSTDDALNNLTL
jgi:hypothetical protein